MAWLSNHLLTVVTFLPLFGALLLLFVRRDRTQRFAGDSRDFAERPEHGRSGGGCDGGPAAQKRLKAALRRLCVAPEKLDT